MTLARRGNDKRSKFSQYSRTRLDTLFDGTVSIRIEQLTQEGAIQLFQQAGAGMESYIVGTVGTLQFEVLEYRLKNEYIVDITMNMQPYEVARWLAFKDGREVTPAALKGADRGMFVYDRKGNPVLLVSNEWALGWIMDNNPDLILNHVPFDRKEA